MPPATCMAQPDTAEPLAMGRYSRWIRPATRRSSTASPAGQMATGPTQDWCKTLPEVSMAPRSTAAEDVTVRAAELYSESVLMAAKLSSTALLTSRTALARSVASHWIPREISTARRGSAELMALELCSRSRCAAVRKCCTALPAEVTERIRWTRPFSTRLEICTEPQRQAAPPAAVFLG